MSHIEVANGDGLKLICAHCVAAGQRPFVVLTTATEREHALWQVRLHHTLKHAASRSEQRVANGGLAA